LSLSKGTVSIGSTYWGVNGYFEEGFVYLESVFKQRVQIYLRTRRPFSLIVARCTFGLNCRLVFFCEKLTLFPDNGPLPHTSHLAIISPRPDKLKATKRPLERFKKSGWDYNQGKVFVQTVIGNL